MFGRRLTHLLFLLQKFARCAIGYIGAYVLNPVRKGEEFFNRPLADSLKSPRTHPATFELRRGKKEDFFSGG